jgi:hypothetical protein
MDAAEFTEAVRDDHETPLSRLGSSKWVYALTGGEMAGEAVESAWAREAGAGRETFAAWADEATSDAAAETFAGVAETLGDSGGGESPPETPPAYETLAGLSGTAERAGGLLGWALVAEKTLAQVVGFFVGDADPTTANTYREYRSAVEAERSAAEALLDEVCDDDAAWTAAREGADAVVEAAYADYVETLESMGVKPKNVC